MLPFLTEADPDSLGEGSLDPLGLAPIADRLADSIAPDVTARMSRVRFLAAIAVGATVCDEIAEESAADGKTPPYLVYEWLVVEALARRKQSSETEGVPGIQKARRTLARSWSAHLEAGSYLQVPKVFGFHGVYKRLARAAQLVDDGLVLVRSGDELVRLWEREQRLPGFADRTPGTPGGKLARRLTEETRKGLAKGQLVTPPGSQVWTQLAEAVAPNDAGRRERLLLWNSLIDERQPIRRELVLALSELPGTGSEADALRAVGPRASSKLRNRLRAIEAYERVAGLLNGVFRTMLSASTGQGTKPVKPTDLAASPAVTQAASDLPDALRGAGDWLGPLGHGAELEQRLGHFAEPHPPVRLVDTVLEHHERIQAGKGGKRPWLERAGAGFYVRSDYRTSEGGGQSGDYIHPYRVDALRSFIFDLNGGH